MEILTQKVERPELKPGDHIYTWRKLIYCHHGIFIGEGKIIHFVDVKSDSLLGISSVGSSYDDGKKKKKNPCPNSFCGSEKVAGSGVRMSCIDCFIKKGSLYLFKYNVSREFLLAKLRGGTCTTAVSDSPEEVIQKAIYLYENGYVGYDVMNNNCEDFALYCKTGLWSNDKQQQGRSSQANMVRRTTTTNKNFLQRAFTAIPRSFSKRENNDLGLRDDVQKVSAEQLSSFIRTLK